MIFQPEFSLAGEHRILSFAEPAPGGDTERLRSGGGERASSEQPKRADLVETTKKLLDVQYGPKTLRERIEQYVLYADRKNEGHLRWLVQGMTTVLEHSDEVMAETETTVDTATNRRVWKQHGKNSPTLSADETELIRQLKERFTSYEAVAAFTFELKFPISREAEQYVQERGVVRTVTALLGEFDTIDQKLPPVNVSACHGEPLEKLQQVRDALGDLAPLLQRVHSVRGSVDALSQESAQDASIDRYKRLFVQNDWDRYIRESTAYIDREINEVQQHALDEAIVSTRTEFAKLVEPIEASYRQRAQLGTAALQALERDMATVLTQLQKLQGTFRGHERRARELAAAPSVEACGKSLSQLQEWTGFVERFSSELPTLRLEAYLRELKADTTITPELKVQLRLEVVRSLQEHLRSAPQEGRFFYEGYRSRETAVLIGRGGQRIRSFGQEGLSPEEYMRKFERVVNTPDLYYTYEELFMDPHQPAMRGAPPPTLVANMRLWGKEVCGVAAKERALLASTGLEFCSEHTMSQYYTSQRHSVRALRSAYETLENAANFYPIEIMGHIPLRSVVVRKNIVSTSPQIGNVGGYQDSKGQYIAIGWSNPEDAVSAYHHEFAHAMCNGKKALDSPTGKDSDVAWAEHVHGKKYDRSYVETWGYSRMVDVAGPRPRGYISAYASQNVWEEQAETWQHLIQSPRSYRTSLALAANEPTLQRAIDGMKGIAYELSDGIMDGQFWEDFSMSDQPNGKRINRQYWEERRRQKQRLAA